jgi:hypothetical protein
MDSCKRALGGASYDLSGTGGSQSASTPGGAGGAVSASAGCPLERGNCSTVTTGCVSFTGVAAGTYTIKTTATPPPNATNPEGYAPCEGGSACQSQVANLTVSSGGGVQATVTDIYPDGTTFVFPAGGSFAGTASDPIVFHDFGLAAPGMAHNAQCDGDSDADDHLTGSPSSHCGYPEAQESSACQPFPWSCQLTGGHLGGGKGGTGGKGHKGHKGTGKSGGTTSGSGGSKSGGSKSGGTTPAITRHH